MTSLSPQDAPNLCPDQPRPTLCIGFARILTATFTLPQVGFEVPGARSVGIRAFLTRDFMTGSPALPGVDMPLACVQVLDNPLSLCVCI